MVTFSYSLNCHAKWTQQLTKHLFQYVSALYSDYFGRVGDLDLKQKYLFLLFIFIILLKIIELY